MDTIYATTVTTRTTTVELPNGATAELPWVMEHRDDVAVVELPDGGYRLGALQWMDDCRGGDPFDEFDQGERIELGRDFWRFDADDVRGAIDGAGGIGNGWRVFLVESSGYPRRDRVEDPARWIYVAPADVPRDRVAAYVDGVWSEWRAWAAGEVYGVCTVDVDADGTERPGTEESCWGYIGDDYAAAELARAMEVRA